MKKVIDLSNCKPPKVGVFKESINSNYLVQSTAISFSKKSNKRITESFDGIV